MNSLENELTAEEFFKSKHGGKGTDEALRDGDNFFPHYWTKLLDEYATLKTSPILEQLEKSNRQIEEIWKPQSIEKSAKCREAMDREIELAKQISALQEQLEKLQEEKDYWERSYHANNAEMVEELSLLKSQLEEAKEVFKVYDFELTAAKGEIERLKADLKYTYEYAEKQREVKQLLVDESLANQSAAGWISMDTLPEKNGIYQVWDNGHEYAHFFNGKWKTLDKQGNGHDNCCGVRTRQEIFPTHWMPLPSPPSLQENTKF